MMSHLTIDSIHFQPSNQKNLQSFPQVFWQIFSPREPCDTPPSDSRKSWARPEEVEPKSGCWIPVIFRMIKRGHDFPQFYRIHGTFKIYLPYT